jgi:TfoX/Sxy family transcriptional regulator of competence genes
VRAAWRKDLEHVLNAFVADHRGLRIGRMFGLPGAYAGHKLFACVYQDGLTVKLPADARTAALDRGATPWTPMGRRMREWVLFRPESPQASSSVLPFLELAARHAAQLATSRPASTSPARSHARARFAADAAASRKRRPDAPPRVAVRLPKRPR